MISVTYKNAMAEVLEYLKGIRKEDVNKIPKNFLNYLEQNASKDYKCNFDYTKSLKELPLLDESKAIISVICFNYWCETNEQKEKFKNNLIKNEAKYQEILREKYNTDNLFKKEEPKNIVKEEPPKETSIVEYKENWFKKFINKIKKIFHK